MESIGIILFIALLGFSNIALAVSYDSWINWFVGGFILGVDFSIIIIEVRDSQCQQPKS